MIQQNDWVMLDPKHPKNVPGDEFYDRIGNRVRQVLYVKNNIVYVNFFPEEGDSKVDLPENRLVVVTEAEDQLKEGDRVIFNNIHPENDNPREGDILLYYPHLKMCIGEVLYTWEVEDGPKCKVMAGKVEYLTKGFSGMVTLELTRLHRAFH